MKITVKTGLLFAAAWIVVKLIMFMTGITGHNVVPGAMINILFLLLSIAVGLYLYKRNSEEQGNALLDIKNAMSAGVPYTIVVSVFIFFYYKSINPEFNRHQIAESEMFIKKSLDDENELKKLRASHEEFEVLTKDEIFEELRKGPQSFYNPTATMTVSLLAMLVLSTFYSLLVTIIYRRIVFKNS